MAAVDRTGWEEVEPSGRFFALFDGDPVWHERLSLRKLKKAHIIVSPDGDAYIEEFGD